MHKDLSFDHKIYTSFCSCLGGQQPPQFSNTSKTYLCCVIRTRVIGRTSSKILWRTRKFGVLMTYIEQQKTTWTQIWAYRKASDWVEHSLVLEGDSVVTPKNRTFDMLVNNKVQTPFKILTINIKQQKQFVVKNKPDFNWKAKASYFLMGSSRI